MAAIFTCCLLTVMTDYYFSPHRELSPTEQVVDTFIWPSLFGVLYILAGASLETKYGLFNEKHIMVLSFFLTQTAFLVSLRKNSMSLSIMALLLGMAMPFIIEDAYDTPTAVLYSSLIISSAIGLYLYHGWALLLLAAAFGFWGAMHLHNLLALSRQDTEIIRAVVFCHWVQFWGSTMIRERLLYGSTFQVTPKAQERRQTSKRKPKLTSSMGGGHPLDRKSTRLNSSHVSQSRMPSSA